MPDGNQQVIEEFRAHEGRVGGEFGGLDVLLITHTGAKSGKKRVSPLVYAVVGDRIVVAASRRGADTNPDWYYNLVANPEVTVELGTEKFQATAKLIEDRTERDRVYAGMTDYAAARRPGGVGFAEFQEKTTRVIPVFVLER